VVKPEGKRSLGRSSVKWGDNIKIDLQEMWWEGMDLTDLAEDRYWWPARVNAVMNLGGA
jgi:hypothetical protein